LHTLRQFHQRLRTALTCADHKSAKRQSSHQWLFCTFGICGWKSCLQNLLKLTNNFTNILRAAFVVQKCFAQLLSNYSLALYFFVKRISVQKLLIKHWWNCAPSLIDLWSISSTFYMRIFHTKFCSKPNSKERKAAQKTFVQKIRA